MRCPRVSRGRVYAGFTGCIANATRGGCTAAAPAAPDAPLEPAAAPPVAFPEPAALAASAEFTPAIPSASAATFGVGIEGNSRAAPESFAATLTASGTFAADLPIPRSAVARLAEGSLPAASFTSVLARATRSPLAIRRIYCTEGQLALAHWSHSAWYPSLTLPFAVFQTPVLAGLVQNFPLFRHLLALPAAFSRRVFSFLTSNVQPRTSAFCYNPAHRAREFGGL